MKSSTKPQSSSQSELRSEDRATTVAVAGGPFDPRFRLAFERSPLGMAIIGLDYKLQRANKALCLAVGYTEAELSSENYINITHPDDIEKGRDLRDELIRGEIPSYRMEKRY